MDWLMTVFIIIWMISLVIAFSSAVIVLISTAFIIEFKYSTKHMKRFIDDKKV